MKKIKEKKPWEELGISKSAYYRAKQSGRDPSKIKPRRKKGEEVTLTPLEFSEEFTAEDMVDAVRAAVFNRHRSDKILTASQVDDLVQDIVSTIYMTYGKYQPFRSPRGYILTAAANLYRNAITHLKMRKNKISSLGDLSIADRSRAIKKW